MKLMDTCKKCGVHIQEFITGRKKVSGELYCKHCYYEELGKVIEKHPLQGPPYHMVSLDCEN